MVMQLLRALGRRWPWLATFVALVIIAFVTCAWGIYQLAYVPSKVIVGWKLGADPPVTREQAREACHQVLRYGIAGPHDAFLTLGEVGDASSVPVLIDAYERGPGSDELPGECTWWHCIDTLWLLTGTRFQTAREWRAWYAGHGQESREQWLTTALTERGFAVGGDSSVETVRELLRALGTEQVQEDGEEKEFAFASGRHPQRQAMFLLRQQEPDLIRSAQMEAIADGGVAERLGVARFWRWTVPGEAPRSEARRQLEQLSSDGEPGVRLLATRARAALDWGWRALQADAVRRSYDTGFTGTDRSVAGEGGIIYFTGTAPDRHRHLVAWSHEAGKVLWSQLIDDWEVELAVTEETLECRHSDGSLVARDLRTGTITGQRIAEDPPSMPAWVSRPAPEDVVGVAVFGDLAIAASMIDEGCWPRDSAVRLTAWSLSTHEEVYSREICPLAEDDGCTRSVLMLPGQGLLLVVLNDWTGAVNPATGELAWQSGVGGELVEASAVVVIDDGWSVALIDAATGELLARCDEEFEPSLKRAVHRADDQLVVVVDGAVVVLDLPSEEAEVPK
jgi:hypothetical protein